MQARARQGHAASLGPGEACPLHGHHSALCHHCLPRGYSPRLPTTQKTQLRACPAQNSTGCPPTHLEKVPASSVPITAGDPPRSGACPLTDRVLALGSCTMGSPCPSPQPLPPQGLGAAHPSARSAPTLCFALMPCWGGDAPQMSHSLFPWLGSSPQR